MGAARFAGGSAAVIDRRRFTLGCGCMGMLGALGVVPRLSLAGETDWQMPPVLARPDPGSDEGGLWALLDREEARLRRSRFLIGDAALREQVTAIACRLAGDHCPQMRVYLVRAPFFNATMAPNGMMQVWSGLLLRMGNEAQLAAVLGHEIGHYLARHSLERLRDAKSRSAFGQFLGIALNAAGAGGAGLLSQLALLAGAFAYSREHELEADRIGAHLMARAGFPPIEASRVWRQLMEELEAERAWTGESDRRSVLFATHPPEQERQARLEALAAALARPGEANAATDADADAYRRMLAGHRVAFLEDEIRRRRPGETIALLDRMLRTESADGVLHFFRGEALRLRQGAGDTAAALEAYEQAERVGPALPELYRSRGLILQGQSRDREAAEAFRHYLRLRPDAPDAQMIASYIKEGV